MEKSTEISSKFWNLLQKPFEELSRETLFIDDIISKHHIEKEIMENKGLRNIKYAGPGALSRSIPGEVLINIMQDKKLKKEFLEFCYEYDSQKWVAGMGKDNILINAEI